jgi:hypothetical protein
MGSRSVLCGAIGFAPREAIKALVSVVLVAACAVSILAQSQAGPAGSLRILVIAGEDAVNVVQQRTAVAPIVEVRDRNDLPIAGVPVTFTIAAGGANASFAGGLQSLIVTTNAAGRAVVTGLSPLSSGAVQINVAAAFQGQTAVATIAQTNVLTAAQAAAATGATGGGSGGGAGAGGAAGGGGGVSGTTIGVVGAVAGGAAIAGAKVLGAQGEGDDGADDGSGNHVVWNIAFTTSPGLDFSACRPQTSFCSQVVEAAADGTFDDVWAPSTPNVVRVTGTVNATTFSATMSCISTPVTGTLSATWDGTAYVGAAMLGQATSQIRVTRRDPASNGCI